mgnify:CR=1 FL=1
MKKSQSDGKRPRLSELERQIMQIIWDKGKANSRQIKETFDEIRPLAINTILTVMRRLEKKNYIKEVPRIGRAKMYKPVVPREMVAKKSLRRLLEGLYRGSASSMVAQLLNTENIQEDELEGIRQMLDRKFKKKKR